MTKEQAQQWLSVTGESGRRLLAFVEVLILGFLAMLCGIPLGRVIIYVAMSGALDELTATSVSVLIGTSFGMLIAVLFYHAGRSSYACAILNRLKASLSAEEGLILKLKTLSPTAELIIHQKCSVGFVLMSGVSLLMIVSLAYYEASALNKSVVAVTAPLLVTAIAGWCFVGTRGFAFREGLRAWKILHQSDGVGE